MVDLIDRVFVPGPNYVFPTKKIGKQMRAFNAKWLPLFNGLTYSALEDAAFCLPCVMFGNTSGAGASLVTTGFRDWKDAMSKFNGHFLGTVTGRKDSSKGGLGHERHKDALARFISFKAQVKSHTNVANQVDQQRKTQVNKNRAALKSIISSVVFLGVQGLPFRGHRDDMKMLNDPAHNPGNFQSLLKFRVESGDNTLQEHFQEGHKNAT